MKHLKHIITILFFSLILASCGNDSKKVTTEIKNATQTLKNVKNVSKEASALQKNIEELRKKVPLTKEQWEAWLPENVIDLPLSAPQINFMAGLGTCAASYKVGNKKIRVMVIDGAGERGAGGVGPYRMSSSMEYDNKDKWGYTKTVIIDGVKAKKSYVKTSGMYSLSMFYAERFAVDIEIHELEEHTLEQIFKELNFSELKNFK